jgi:hypothetical protein
MRYLLPFFPEQLRIKTELRGRTRGRTRGTGNGRKQKPELAGVDLKRGKEEMDGK